MRARFVLCWIVGGMVVGRAWGSPVAANSLPHSLGPELGSRLSSISSRLQEPRLPLPSPQDLEAIKKVAQILVMLGEQVIPAIIGEPTPPFNCIHFANMEEVASDPANEKQIQ